MSQISERSDPPNATEALYPDTGESGEAYDIDYGTLSLPKPYRLSELFYSLMTPIEHLADAEGGETYEAEIEATHESRNPEALLALPSGSYEWHPTSQ